MKKPVGIELIAGFKTMHVFTFGLKNGGSRSAGNLANGRLQ